MSDQINNQVPGSRAGNAPVPGSVSVYFPVSKVARTFGRGLSQSPKLMASFVTPSEQPTGTRVVVATRRGFSLIELLIALAILTTVAALVLPSLRSPLDRSRLRSAAVEVSNTWAKARRLAIRQGKQMSFRCRLKGRHWKIEHAAPVDRLGGEASTQSLADAGPEQNGPASTLVREGWLPEGVTFDTLHLPSTRIAASHEGSVEGEASTENSSAESAWSKPLNFRPEGRSQDAKLRLAGAKGLVVEVKMRGLTAAVAYTAPSRRRAKQQAGSVP